MTQDTLTGGLVETRATGEITQVDFPQRTIEVIVMPYEQATSVEHAGRTVQEICSRGAFDGIERRPNRVRVNYHHQDNELRYQLGHAVAFYPNRPEGLVAKLKIHKGGDRDDALELASVGGLGASAGFKIMADGETWVGRSLRRLTRVWLDHVALTPTPAYPGAEVLAVRHADPAAGMPVATPNLDIVRAWQLEKAYDLTQR